LTLTNEAIDAAEALTAEALAHYLETGEGPFTDLSVLPDREEVEEELAELLAKHREALSEASSEFLFNFIRNATEPDGKSAARLAGVVSSMSDDQIAAMEVAAAGEAEEIRLGVIGRRRALLDDVKTVAGGIFELLLAVGLKEAMALADE
jgi:hypothetical protein